MVPGPVLIAACTAPAQTDEPSSNLSAVETTKFVRLRIDTIMQFYSSNVIQDFLFSVQPDDSWTRSDCNYQCTCTNGRAECQSISCGDNQVCGVKNGEPRCYCEDGYTLVGEECTLGMSTVMIMVEFYRSGKVRVTSYIIGNHESRNNHE